MRIIKKGIPIKEVMSPTGRSAPEIRIFESMEATERIKAPKRAETGSRKRWSSPVSPLARWGATRPKNPMVPTKQTAVAVSSETSMMTWQRSW